MKGIQIRIGDLLYAVIKRWKMVLALTIIGFGFGVAMNGIAYMQGRNMNYEITCSIAITTQNSNNNFTGNSDYLNPNDFYLSQDMTDAATYVIESKHVLAEALDTAGITSITPNELGKNLTVERYNETQILELTLYWSSEKKGLELMNAILKSARSTMLKTLSVGAVPEINEPEAKYISDGSSYAGLWILMTALGFLAGVGVALLDLIMRPTLLNLDDVDRLFGLETIGVIPADEVYFKNTGNMLVRDKERNSPVEQDFSSAAYILKNLLGTKKGQKSFFITSVEDGEGKSTVAANLAIQLSDMGKKVLLLDLDMRNPGLGRLFLDNVDYSRSLNAIYKGEAESEEAIISLTGYLDFLPMVLERNVIPMDDTLFEFVKQLSQGYEYVVIDAPSVGQTSNALSLNQIADMAVLVIRYDAAVIQDIQNAIDKLDKSGTRILGCIVNAAQTIERLGSQGTKKAAGRYAGKPAKSSESSGFYEKDKEEPELQDKISAENVVQTPTNVPSENTPKTTRNIFEDFAGSSMEDEEFISDQDAMDALLKMGMDGSWKNEAEKSDSEEKRSGSEE